MDDAFVFLVDFCCSSKEMETCLMCLEALFLYCDAHAVQNMVAVRLDADLDACCRRAGEEVSHGHLAAGMEVRFRILEQEEAAGPAGQESHDHRERVAQPETDTCWSQT